jgi:hypothetical protein
VLAVQPQERERCLFPHKALRRAVAQPSDRRS